MRVKLTPMPGDFYERFVDDAVANYSRDAVSSGRWDAGVAEEKSRAELNGFLKQGLQTPGHWLFLVENESSEVMGTVWLGEAPRGERRVAYIYDLHIYSQFRRRGVATAALAEVEALARAKGFPAIQLHAFGHNAEAIALYRKIGYAITDVVMAKPIAAQ